MAKHKLTISIEEGAGMCGCCINTFRKLMRKKNFPSVKVGRRILIPEKSFIEWLHNEASKSDDLYQF